MLRRRFLALAGLAPLAAPAALASLPDDPKGALPLRPTRPENIPVSLYAYSLENKTIISAWAEPVAGCCRGWTLRILRDGGLISIHPLNFLPSPGLYPVADGGEGSLRTLVTTAANSDPMSWSTYVAELCDDVGNCVGRSGSVTTRYWRPDA